MNFDAKNLAVLRQFVAIVKSQRESTPASLAFMTLFGSCRLCILGVFWHSEHPADSTTALYQGVRVGMGPKGELYSLQQPWHDWFPH